MMMMKLHATVAVATLCGLAHASNKTASAYTGWGYKPYGVDGMRVPCFFSASVPTADRKFFVSQMKGSEKISYYKYRCPECAKQGIDTPLKPASRYRMVRTADGSLRPNTCVKTLFPGETERNTIARRLCPNRTRHIGYTDEDYLKNMWAFSHWTLYPSESNKEISLMDQAKNNYLRYNSQGEFLPVVKQVPAKQDEANQD